MDKNKIIEGNKLIAIFDDLVLHTDDPEYGEVFYHKGDKYKINRYPIHELKYHSSWDWLMPIWKKLGSLLYARKEDFTKEQYQQANIYTVHILTAFREVNIESAFNWISETIQWYNQQNPNLVTVK